MKNEETLYKHVAEISEDGDIIESHSEAIHAFRQKHPDIILWQGNITIGYEKA